MNDGLSSALLQFIQKNTISTLLVFSGVLFIIISFFLLSSSQKPNDSSLTSQQSITQQISTPIPQKSAQIIIDIEGAVNKPGVYALQPQSRVQDAIVAASGFAVNVDQSKVSQTLNLAAKLTDSMKIYIPKIGDTQASSVLDASTDVGQAGSTGLININTASLSDLDALPGIGQVTGQKIIDNRPYTSVEDLLNKKIIKSNVYGEIKDRISVE